MKGQALQGLIKLLRYLQYRKFHLPSDGDTYPSDDPWIEGEIRIRTQHSLNFYHDRPIGRNELSADMHSANPDTPLTWRDLASLRYSWNGKASFDGRPRALLVILMLVLIVPSFAQQNLSISRSDFRDRVEAVWKAQMIAVIMGWQFEHKQASVRWVDSYQDDKMESLKKNGGAMLDDDWYYEMAALRAFQKFGPDLTIEQLGRQWVENKVGTWGSSEMARLNLEKGIPASESGHPVNNRLWFTMGNQCRGEFFGLLAPGRPDVAARLSSELGHINSYAEGADGGVVVSTMISLAFVERDPRKIIKESVKVLHPATPHRRCLDKVIFEAENGKSFREVCNNVEDEWHIVYPATNNSVANMGLAVASLWFGEGDFMKTINLAYSAADFSDADCNAAVAASVVAAIHGSEVLPKNLTEPLRNRIRGTHLGPLEVKPSVDISITTLADQTVEVAEKIMKKEGVPIHEDSFFIKEVRLSEIPAEVFSPNEFSNYWNKDWILERAGHGAPGGGHRGIRGGTFLDGDILSTFPRDEVRGVVLRRELQVMNGDSLKFAVAADPGRTWKLEVFIDNTKVLSQLVDGGPPISWFGIRDDYFPSPTEEYKASSCVRKFRDIAIDLSRYRDTLIMIRLYQHTLVRNRYPGNAYWRSVVIE